MVATLQSRKEALEAKILEKNEELKKLCLQEADLTGVMPPEIPLEPGEPPPPIRRRVGTSFSFPQNLINNVKDADDESLTALELECRVQINIAEAALALANDASANKAARRKHRLMYRQSQRRLMELETRLNLLKQSKSQQIKKKPRPNTTAVENFFWKKNDQNSNYCGGDYLGSWPGKMKPTYSADDSEKGREFTRQTDAFCSLQRSFKTGTASQSSSGLRTDTSNDEFKIGTHQVISSSKSFPCNLMSGSASYNNVQSSEGNKLNINANAQHSKRNMKKAIVRKQWDTQSAGGTLLPSQTYPEHSHQPNLNRTQSLGSVESNTQKSKDSWSVQDLSYDNGGKEKEWYETALDSAPSPPLRTTSRLPSITRMLYQMQELQARQGGVAWNVPNINNLQSCVSIPPVTTPPNLMLKTFIKTLPESAPTENSHLGVDKLSNSIQQMQLNTNKKEKIGSNVYRDDFGVLNKDDLFYSIGSNEKQEAINYPVAMTKVPTESSVLPAESNAELDLTYPSTSTDPRFFQSNENNVGLPLSRQNSLNQAKFKITAKEAERPIKGIDSMPTAVSNGLYMNIPVDSTDGSLKNWLSEEEFPNQIKTGQVAVPQEYVPKTQTPTQPYYHTTKNSTGEKIKNLQYQAAKNRHASVSEEQIADKTPSPVQLGAHHPPHAITQNEISFDTVVPFESPQNHTVVQAGKWQPYREVTKPFEMSDFYKYSTKFRQNQAQANRAVTPDVTSNSQNPVHQKGVYTPLKPMTCRPVESKSNQTMAANNVNYQYNETGKTMVEVSPPEIV